ncbi:MAG: hypothetical protein ACTSU3_06770 [Candidatus Thorarchaeota archaeon]
MSKRILILGMNAFDSGKTILAENIARILLENTTKVEYFKPVSGHNYWYKQAHTKQCIEQGKLFSSDAAQVRKQLETKIPIEIANPVHSLFVPAVRDNPNQLLTSSLSIAGWDAVLALQRFTRVENGKPISTMLVAESLIESEKLLLSTEETNALTANTEIQPIASLEDVQTFEFAAFEGVVNDSFETTENNTEVVIIEGFNNSAWPWEGLDHADVILLVGPGHVFSYSPERFRKAAFLVKYGSQPIRDVPIGRVSEMIKPVNRLLLAPDTQITHSDLERLGLLREKMIK